MRSFHRECRNKSKIVLICVDVDAGAAGGVEVDQGHVLKHHIFTNTTGRARARHHWTHLRNQAR